MLYYKTLKPLANLEIEDKILTTLSENLIEHIVRKTILSLQKMKTNLSGADSGLTNVWEEVCVQVQHEESFYGNIYEEEVYSIILSFINKISNTEKTLLWLMTENGSSYYDRDHSSSEELVYNDSDIVEYIKNGYLYSKAMDWSNERIRKYLNL